MGKTLIRFEKKVISKKKTIDSFMCRCIDFLDEAENVRILTHGPPVHDNVCAVDLAIV